MIGLAIAALEDVASKLPRPARTALAVTCAVALALMAFGSSQYAETFIGPEALWTYTVAHNPGTYLAHGNLGVVYLETNRTAAGHRRTEGSDSAQPRHDGSMVQSRFCDE